MKTITLPSLPPELLKIEGIKSLFHCIEHVVRNSCTATRKEPSKSTEDKFIEAVKQSIGETSGSQNVSVYALSDDYSVIKQLSAYLDKVAAVLVAKSDKQAKNHRESGSIEKSKSTLGIFARSTSSQEATSPLPQSSSATSFDLIPNSRSGTRHDTSESKHKYRVPTPESRLGLEGKKNSFASRPAQRLSQRSAVPTSLERKGSHSRMLSTTKKKTGKEAFQTDVSDLFNFEPLKDTQAIDTNKETSPLIRSGSDDSLCSSNSEYCSSDNEFSSRFPIGSGSPVPTIVNFDAKIEEFRRKVQEEEEWSAKMKAEQASQIAQSHQAHHGHHQTPPNPHLQHHVLLPSSNSIHNITTSPSPQSPPQHHKVPPPPVGANRPKLHPLRMLKTTSTPCVNLQSGC